MFFADTHCDSIGTLERGAPCVANAYNMAPQHLQFVALFTDRPHQSPDACWQLLCSYRAMLREQGARFGDSLALCRTAGQARAALAAGKKALFFSMEGATALDGRPQRLAEVAAEGLRCLSLTWNQNNLYGCANPYNGTADDTGLSAAGRQLVAACGERGILLDVSHASDRTCEDILAVSALPVLATHSNFRAVCGHPRNLTDAQALAIRDSGGLIGLNIYPTFLGGDTLDDLLRQLDYGLRLVGEDALCFGFDIDGIETYPAGLDMGRSLHVQVAELLAQKGYPQPMIEKLAGKNVLRVLEAVCP